MMTPIETIQAAAGIPLPHIEAAERRAEETLARLRTTLADVAPVDTSITVFGSLARLELSGNSDLDWTLLVDGQANPQHLDAALTIEALLEDSLGIEPPGREGTFGGLAFSHDILHKIGGGEDTNRNTTQRILLLLESAAVTDAGAYDRLIRAILKRYVAEDYGWVHKSVNVPRLLQNDIARYWRTVAVDFAYKRRQRRGSGWALRTVKLRMSRKLTYGSGLLVCFSPVIGLISTPDTNADASERTLSLISDMISLLNRTPLERFALLADRFPAIQPDIAKMLNAYDSFLAMLDDEEARQHLELLPPDSAEADDTYQKARKLGHLLQEGLDGIFFQQEATGIPALTRKYGVF